MGHSKQKGVFDLALVMGYGTLLFLVYAAPALLTLSPLTYGRVMSLAHFVVFLVSIVGFVGLGHALARRGRPRFGVGVGLGGLIGALGTAVTQYVAHLPAAETAFIQQLHGVPRAAAVTMLHLHLVTSIILSILMNAVIWAFVGGLATWWGGLVVRRPRPDQSTAEQDQSVG